MTRRSLRLSSQQRGFGEADVDSIRGLQRWDPLAFEDGIQNIDILQIPTFAAGDTRPDRAAKASLYARRLFPYRSLRMLIDSAVWPADYAAIGGYQLQTPPYLDLPRGRESTDIGWGDSVNGITHDERYWYFSTVIRSGLLSRTSGGLPVGGGRATGCRLFKVDNLETGAVVASSDRPDVDEQGRSLRHIGHYGDIDLEIRPGARRLLWVPIEADDLAAVSLYGEEPARNPPGILAFDPDDLGTVIHSHFFESSIQKDAPWVAVNPLDGLIYSSNYNAHFLNIFERTTWPDGTFRLILVGRLYLTDPTGRRITIHEIQGGVFSPQGHLYLSSSSNRWIVDSAFHPDLVVLGTRRDYAPGPGVLGVDILTGRVSAQFFVKTEATGFMNPGRQEVEGLTIWDRSLSSSAVEGLRVRRRIRTSFGPRGPHGSQLRRGIRPESSRFLRDPEHAMK